MLTNSNIKRLLCLCVKSCVKLCLLLSFSSPRQFQGLPSSNFVPDFFYSQNPPLCSLALSKYCLYSPKISLFPDKMTQFDHLISSTVFVDRFFTSVVCDVGEGLATTTMLFNILYQNEERKMSLENRLWHFRNTLSLSLTQSLAIKAKRKEKKFCNQGIRWSLSLSLVFRSPVAS